MQNYSNVCIFFLYFLCDYWGKTISEDDIFLKLYWLVNSLLWCTFLSLQSNSRKLKRKMGRALRWSTGFSLSSIAHNYNIVFRVFLCTTLLVYNVITWSFISFKLQVELWWLIDSMLIALTFVYSPIKRMHLYSPTCSLFGEVGITQGMMKCHFNFTLFNKYGVPVY